MEKLDTIEINTPTYATPETQFTGKSGSRITLEQQVGVQISSPQPQYVAVSQSGSPLLFKFVGIQIRKLSSPLFILLWVLGMGFIGILKMANPDP
jgi:hypothetical protein